MHPLKATSFPEDIVYKPHLCIRCSCLQSARIRTLMQVCCSTDRVSHSSAYNSLHWLPQTGTYFFLHIRMYAHTFLGPLLSLGSDVSLPYNLDAPLDRTDCCKFSKKLCLQYIEKYGNLGCSSFIAKLMLNKSVPFTSGGSQTIWLTPIS